MAVHPIVNHAQYVPLDQPVIEANPISREVTDLQNLCLEKHEQKGKVIAFVINVATLVAAVWAGVMLGGISGFFLGCGIYLIAGNLIESIYHGLRSREYTDAGNALVSSDFRAYIHRNNFDLSIESIVTVHANYKAYLQSQIGQEIV